METLSAYLPYVQITLSILIIILVLLQQSEGSLGGAFGGSMSGSQTHFEKRGADKIIFQATIVLGILFVASTIATLFV